MHCHQCGHQEAENERFCTQCGVPLVHREAKDLAVPAGMERPNVAVRKGRILESKIKKASPIAKLFSGLGCLFISAYYLVAIALCFTLVGAIFGILMFIG